MSGAVLLGLRVLLAGVFGVAGASKLANRESFRLTLADFGVPSGCTGACSVALPAAELVVAALLIVSRTALAGALAALVLLGVFCAAMVRSLARGERPDCGCAGRLRPTPIGPAALVRNAVLAGVASLVVAGGAGESVGSALDGVHTSPLRLAVAAIAVLALVQGWFAWQLLRQHGRLLARVRMLEEPQSASPPEGLVVGEQAPFLELADGVSLDDRLASSGVPVALVFSNTGCGACETLASELDVLRVMREGELDIVLVEDDRDAFAAYRISTVPSATIVGFGRRIASLTATGTAAVEELLMSAAGSSVSVGAAV